MGIFGKETTLLLPAKKAFNTKIDGNIVERLYFSSVKVEVVIRETEAYQGVYELTTNLPEPFDLLFLRKCNTRNNLPEKKLLLRSEGNIEIKDINENTILKWEQYPFEENNLLTPKQVFQSWDNKFFFREESVTKNKMGLRPPQLGALHAISAHFTCNAKNVPATIVLPTGTGKTETMLATLIYQQCSKLLVLVPTNNLRNQIYDKFLSMGYLATLGIVPRNLSLPYVAKITKGLQRVDLAKKLIEQSNVIIATPNILNHCNDQVRKLICNSCSHLFIDEAHHVSASTWSEIKELFVDKKIVQFTATPFRRDGKVLDGKIIYNYSMGEAQEAGYFRDIQLYPVEEYYSTEQDLIIAGKAISVLKEDIKKGYNHLIMARTDSKKRAEEVFAIYIKLAPEFCPIVVHSNLSRIENEKSLEKLISLESKIVICVDMLGEGYDLPNLKIAAIHDYHKSLPITLQFIGRFTRTSSDMSIGNASVVVNIADSKVDQGLKELYSQDADWNKVLRRLSEQQVEREMQLQEIVDSLEKQGNLHTQLSLWNITPSFTVTLFRTECEEWAPEEYIDILFSCKTHWYSISKEKNILIIVAPRFSGVLWGDFKEIDDLNYKFLIAHWDKNRAALFITSNDYKVFNISELAKNICGEEAELVSGDVIFNVLRNIEYPLAKNLGTSQTGAISFSQFFGSNVTAGLNQIEKSESELNNLNVIGYEDGNKIIWGCSKKAGKVWAPLRGKNIQEWQDWVRSVWDKLNDDSIEENIITKGFLRPIQLTKTIQVSLTQYSGENRYKIRKRIY